MIGCNDWGPLNRWFQLKECADCGVAFFDTTSVGKCASCLEKEKQRKKTEEYENTFGV